MFLREIRCKFLIDTGADVCVVKHSIAEKAGLKLINENTPIHGVGVDTTGKTYLGRVLFGTHSKKIPGAMHTIFVDTEIISGELPGCADRIDGLIGRNVLSFFDFRYNGRTGKVTLRYLK